MEAALRAQSQLARDALAALAQGVQIPWSFRTVRGEVTEEILAAAGEVDLLCLGTAGWSIGTRLRLGSTAQQVSVRSKSVLLLPVRALPSYSQVTVYFDDTQPARRALLAAADLAAILDGNLTVLVGAPNPKMAEHLTQEVTATLQGRPIQVTFRVTALQDLLKGLATIEQPGILVLAGPRRRTLEVLRQMNTPLLLLDGD
jgi:nucleotide-binding universal stress UspA family protein